MGEDDKIISTDDQIIQIQIMEEGNFDFSVLFTHERELARQYCAVF